MTAEPFTLTKPSDAEIIADIVKEVGLRRVNETQAKLDDIKEAIDNIEVFVRQPKSEECIAYTNDQVIESQIKRIISRATELLGVK